MGIDNTTGENNDDWDINGSNTYGLWFARGRFFVFLGPGMLTFSFILKTHVCLVLLSRTILLHGNQARQQGVYPGPILSSWYTLKFIFNSPKRILCISLLTVEWNTPRTQIVKSYRGLIHQPTLALFSRLLFVVWKQQLKIHPLKLSKTTAGLNWATWLETCQDLMSDWNSCNYKDRKISALLIPIFSLTKTV